MENYVNLYENLLHFVENSYKNKYTISMDTIDKTEILNKTNTNLLIDYLEGVIVDEMILNSFIRDLKIIDIANNKVIIQVKNVETMNYLNDNHKDQLQIAIRDVFSNEGITEYSLLLAGEEIIKEKIENKIESKFISEKFTFDNFVEGTYNKEPLLMIKKSIKALGKFSPLFIYSKSGLGKTHMLHAAGNELIKNGNTCMYVEPNKFTKDITELSKLGGDSITNYIDKIKKYDALLFDDIQNLGDRSVTLRVLFEILNTFIENKKQIIIASDNSPAELSGFQERFITRFSSGLTTTIKKPTINDLIKILEFKLEMENLDPEKWEKEALTFIARNNSNSIRNIEGAVKRVSFYIELSPQIRYTYTVISNIFKELSINADEVTPNRIIQSVSGYYKISKAEIVGKSRKKEIALARHMAIWLVRKILDLPYAEIGRIFGNRDHSTIMNSIESTDKKMLINNVVKTAANSIEQKIRSNS